MADLSLFESFDGGELVLVGNDLQLTEGLFNQVYLALFGGNVEQSTSDVNEQVQQRFDFWGNGLFFPDEAEFQFNSRTERALNEVALDSAGLLRLEQIIAEDLRFLEQLAEVEVNVIVEGVNRAKINVLLRQPEGLEEQRFTFLWDGTREEEITILPQIDETQGITMTLNTPVLQSLIVNGDTQISIIFTDVNSNPNETNVEVQRADDAAFTTNVVAEIIAADSTTHPFKGLTASTQYFFRVRAKGNGTNILDSSFSNVQSATTGATEGFFPLLLLDTQGPTDGFDHRFISSAVQNPVNGEIVVAYKTDTGHIPTIDSHIRMKRGLEFWSNVTPEFVVVDPPGSDSAHENTIYIDATGRHHLVYTLEDRTDPQGGNNNRLNYRSSANGGHTWSTDVDIKPAVVSAKAVYPFGNFFQLSNGNLFFTFYAYTDTGGFLGTTGTYEVYAMISSDAGLTWTPHRIHDGTAATGSNKNASETSVVEVENGILFAVHRINGQAYLWSYSFNSGQTWTQGNATQYQFGDPAPAISHPCELHLFTMPSGTSIVVASWYDRSAVPELLQVIYARVEDVKRLGVHAFVELTKTTIDNTTEPNQGYHSIVHFRNRWNATMFLTDGSTGSANLDTYRMKSDHITTVDGQLPTTVYVNETLGDILSEYTGLTPTESTAVTNFVNGLIDDGNLYCLRELFIFYLSGANALRGIKGTTAINNGATKVANGFTDFNVAGPNYIDVGLSPSQVPLFDQNGMFQLTYIHEWTFTSFGMAFGAKDAATQEYSLYSGNLSTRHFFGMGGGASEDTNSADRIESAEMRMVRRRGTLLESFKGTNQVSAVTNTFTSYVNANYFVGARNNNGVADFPSNSTIGLFALGHAAIFNYPAFVSRHAALRTDLGI